MRLVVKHEHNPNDINLYYQFGEIRLPPSHIIKKKKNHLYWIRIEICMNAPKRANYSSIFKKKFIVLEFIFNLRNSTVIKLIIPTLRLEVQYFHSTYW